MLKRSPISYIGGYIFHFGLAVIVFLFAPHILLITNLTGLSWPALPSQFVDLTRGGVRVSDDFYDSREVRLERISS